MRLVFSFKIFLFVYLLLMKVSGANAQINKVIGYPDNSLATSMALKTNKFVLSGVYVNNNWMQITFLLGTDSIFNLEKLILFVDSAAIMTPGYKNLIKTPAGYTVLYTAGTSQTAVSYLFFLDDSLNVLNTKEFSSSTGVLDALNTIRHPDGGYLITGKTAESGFTGYDIFLLRTDSLGNELWRRTYGQTGVNERPGRAFHIQGEEYFVPIFRPINYSDGYIGYGGYLLKYSYPNVNFNIKKFHRDFQFESSFVDILPTEDGNFIGVGYLSDGNDNISTHNWMNKGRVTKIDSSMNVIFDKEIGYEYNHRAGLSFIDSLNNGNYLIVGGLIKKYDANPSLPMAWALKVNANWEILWERNYFFYTSLNAVNANYDVTKLNDNSFAICGYAMDDTHNQQIWVVKTDSFGCVVPGCQMYDGVENPEEAFSMQIFPNPAQDFLNIYVPPGKDRHDVRIYDSRGALVQSLKLLPAAATTMVYIRNLAPGLYFLSHGGEAIKFVKE